MFCNQCEQAQFGTGCGFMAVCGKPPAVSDLFDLLVWRAKGIAWLAADARSKGRRDGDVDRFLIQALFVTVTNVNFDLRRVDEWVRRADEISARAAQLADVEITDGRVPEAAGYRAEGRSQAELLQEAELHPITHLNPNPDLQSLLQLLTFGLKGLAAYAEHAADLDCTDETVFDFIVEALAAELRDDLTAEELIALNLRCGEVNIRCMEMLNEAHVAHYGVPEPTEVPTSLRPGPAIVVSGHDLPMLERLLGQCDGTDVNVYTHGEMLPAHGYPKLKAHPSLAGHFGTAWQNQQIEFDNQPAAFVFNTNCIQRPMPSYADQVFTTQLVGWPGAQHIDDADFSPVIEKAMALGGFQATDGTPLMTGFGHDAVLGLADTIVEGVQTGAIKHFFLVGGCDGAKPGRNYFTDFVENTPEDSIVLTLACGKFRFNHLQQKLGTIGDVPRLLDIGQCNDAYSAIRIATALAEAFECDVNDLPLSMIISWYEQKAIVVLLSLLHLGIRGIRLGPSLPAFLTPNVLQVLVDTFDLKPIGTSARGDLEEILPIQKSDETTAH